MNEYGLSDIFVGMEECFQVTITEEMQENFLRYTGDNNPLHVDAAYAKSKLYDSTVVYGMLTASFYSTLIGVHIPGKYGLLQEVNTSFHYPVYAGDQLTISGKVTEKNDALHRITIKAKIVNQLGKRVSKATIAAGIMEDRVE